MASRYRLVGWTYTALCAVLAGNAGPAPAPRSSRVASRSPVAPAPVAPVPSNTADAAAWFRRAKPYCNAVEVGNVERDTPAPKSVEGAGFNAACLALAGRIDAARRAIDGLRDADRPRAANIVFEVGHPVADAGDDRSAGPIMELVVDYVPNHYMALYHAGMAEYMLGQRDLARRNLSAFMQYYSIEDGWRGNARSVLARLADSTAASDPRRPREP